MYSIVDGWLVGPNGQRVASLATDAWGNFTDPLLVASALSPGPSGYFTDFNGVPVSVAALQLQPITDRYGNVIAGAGGGFVLNPNLPIGFSAATQQQQLQYLQTIDAARAGADDLAFGHAGFTWSGGMRSIVEAFATAGIASELTVADVAAAPAATDISTGVDFGADIGAAPTLSGADAGLSGPVDFGPNVGAAPALSGGADAGLEGPISFDTAPSIAVNGAATTPGGGLLDAIKPVQQAVGAIGAARGLINLVAPSKPKPTGSGTAPAPRPAPASSPAPAAAPGFASLLAAALPALLYAFS